MKHIDFIKRIRYYIIMGGSLIEEDREALRKLDRNTVFYTEVKKDIESLYSLGKLPYETKKQVSEFILGKKINGKP